MNLLRGSGLSGLTGMTTCRLPNPWSNTIPLRRPLLGVWREDILAYCRSRNLNPIQDPSNKDTTFFRNRIRHEVLPVLEKNRPGFRRRVWRMANILEGDHDSLQHAVDRLWEELPIEKSADYIAFEVESFVELLKGLQRRLIRRVIHYLRPGFSEISFEIVEKARDFLVDPPKGKETNLAGRVQMVVMGKRVYFATWDAKIPLVAWPQMPVNVKTLELPVPGEIHLSGAWRLRAEQVENTDEVRARALSNKDPFRVWLDAEKVAGTLLIRTRRKGDRFSPLGMEGHSMGVTDFMINEKIPRQTRSQWPLITSHGSVIWIPGHRLAHAVRITAATDKLYFLSLDRDSGTG